MAEIKKSGNEAATAEAPTVAPFQGKHDELLTRAWNQVPQLANFGPMEWNAICDN